MRIDPEDPVKILIYIARGTGSAAVRQNQQTLTTVGMF